MGTEAGKLTDAGVGAYNDFRNNVFYNWLGTAGTGACGPGRARTTSSATSTWRATAATTRAGGSSTAIERRRRDGASSAAQRFVGWAQGVPTPATSRTPTRTATPATGPRWPTRDFGTAAFQGSCVHADAVLRRRRDGGGRVRCACSRTRARAGGAAAPSTRAWPARRAPEPGRIVAWADNPFNSSAAEGTEWRALRRDGDDLAARGLRHRRGRHARRLGAGARLEPGRPPTTTATSTATASRTWRSTSTRSPPGRRPRR